MNDSSRLILVGRNGELLEATILAALNRMSARAVRQFPALKDEVALVEVMEEAGRRIAAKQERAGPIDNFHGYAWVTIRSVATSFMRRGTVRVIQNTLEPEVSETYLTFVPTARWSPQDIEQTVLLREILRKLTSEERRICIWKQAGFSSRDIAERLGRSVAAIDTIFSRAKVKLRRLLASPQIKVERGQSAQRSSERAESREEQPPEKPPNA